MFREVETWRPFGNAWSQLFGNFREQGLSFEWHAFTASRPFNWAHSFHPRSVELCLNLAGDGVVGDGTGEAVFRSHTVGFYCRADDPLRASRNGEQRHEFLTVEFSFEFLRQNLAAFANALDPLVGSVIHGTAPRSGVSRVTRLTARQQSLLQSLREPPVLGAAQPLWYRTKALELAAECFFVESEELFCQRQKRLAADRVEKVQAMLRRDLVNPPTLEDIAKTVGCSAFHLSRTFSTEVGMTIPQYIRRLRMDRAAELLRIGKHNVTEVALEVGYSSLSHFSLAFHQTFGCCPGLYPLNPGHSGVPRE
jgi:AraC-like DNA-binding protein